MYQVFFGQSLVGKFASYEEAMTFSLSFPLVANLPLQVAAC